MPEHQGRARAWRALTLALLHALACVHAAPPRAPHAPHPGRLGDAYWSGHAQGGEEALWRLGGHALDRRGVRERAVVTQTVFSTVVQTQTATTLMTVAPQGSDVPASAVSSAPSAGADASASATVSSVSSSPSESGPSNTNAPAVPVPSTSPDAPGQPTASSGTGAQPVLFLPPAQPQPTSPPTSPAQSPPPQPTDARSADVPPAAPQPSDVATSLLPPSDAEGAHQSSSTTPAAARPTSAPAAPETKPLVMAYYPSYTTSSFPPEKVDFTRYDWVDFAFAVPQDGGGLGWDGADGSAGGVLRRLVARAHAAGKHVKVSVGGWTGSARFSDAVATPARRAAFVDAIVRMYGAYGVDGIDIDWEYPGQAGADGNVYTPQDTGNYLEFLRLLRQQLPPQAKISAAAMTVPWADAHGAPLTDASAFAQVLDWILIMNYDTWGSSSPPGPNAPLSNACHNSTQASASAVAGIAAWTAAGFPASQIVLGVPSYGYISHSTADGLQTRSVRRRRRHVPMHLDGGAGAVGVSASGVGTAGAEGAGVPMVLNEDGNAADGEVQFRDLVQQGVLQYIAAWDANAAAVRDAQAGDADNTDHASGDTTDGAGADSGADDTGSDGSGGDSSGGSDGSGGSDSAGSDADSSDSNDGDSTTPGTLPAGLPLPTLSSTSTAANTLSFAGHTIANVFTGLQGFERRWDACSSTPFLRSARAGQVVAYDDPQSLELKAALARYAGLRGVNLFDAHGDTDAGDLVDALRRGLGL